MSETASLLLKSSELTFGSTTNIGTADTNGTTLTWNNINLRVLLGDLYDKFDRFNLNLNTIATSQANSIELLLMIDVVMLLLMVCHG